MKLKDFLEAIHHHTKDIPNADDLEVIFSVDDEGNEYMKVHFEPSVCVVDNIDEDRWLQITMVDEDNVTKDDVNAIIIN